MPKYSHFDIFAAAKHPLPKTYALNIFIRFHVLQNVDRHFSVVLGTGLGIQKHPLRHEILWVKPKIVMFISII